MATVKNKFTGDAAQLEKEMDRIKRKNIQLEERVQKLADASGKAGKAAEKSANRMTKGIAKASRSVTGLITNYVGLSAAIRAANAHIERQNKLSELSRNKSITVADAQAKVIKNIGDATDGETLSFLNDVRDIRHQSGFQSQAHLLNASASILSGTGGNRELTKGLLSEIAPFFRDSTEELAEFGGALADLMKSSGIQDPKKATAFAMAIQSQARFDSLGGFKQVAPALAAMDIATGGDRLEGARKGAALFAAFGGEAGDVDAALTKGAVTAMAKGLERAAPHLKTFDERLDFVRNNKDAQADVLKDGFRGPMLLLARDFISDANSQAAQTFRRALKEIKADESVVDRKREQLGGLTPELTATSRDRRFAGTLEDFDLSAGRSTRASVQNILGETLFRSNNGVFASFDDWMKKNRSLLAGVTPESAIDLLRERQDMLRNNNAGMKSDEERREALQLIGHAISELASINEKLTPRPAPGRHEERD